MTTAPLPPQIAAATALFVKTARTAPWCDLTTRQICMLLLAYRAPQTIKGLHLDLNVDKPALSRGADHLEKLGLMVRQEGETDRRSVDLILTEHGRRVVEKLAGL